ncbi:MAG: hypothetical protein H6500_00740 [Candidatus Woesearchaeota archaeon]|nr:hypothetical protein [Nanoarchaeota archaeon]USN44359.1 MAG: hypothetical protein H6500_00740 [Candidatus Woesearchaeota archaeon]
MIGRTFFGIVGVVFGVIILLQILSVFNSDIGKRDQNAFFTSLSEHAEQSCKAILSSRSFTLQSKELLGDFLISNIGDNNLCLYSKKKEEVELVYCQRFDCEIESVESIIFQYNQSSSYTCLIRKNALERIEISCKDKSNNPAGQGAALIGAKEWGKYSIPKEAGREEEEFVFQSFSLHIPTETSILYPQLTNEEIKVYEVKSPEEETIRVAGPALVLSLSETKFSSPITLKLPYFENIPDPNSLKVLKQNQYGDWEELEPSFIDTGNKQVQIQTTQLGSFVVGNILES